MKESNENKIELTLKKELDRRRVVVDYKGRSLKNRFDVVLYSAEQKDCSGISEARVLEYLYDDDKYLHEFHRISDDRNGPNTLEKSSFYCKDILKDNYATFCKMKDYSFADFIIAENVSPSLEDEVPFKVYIDGKCVNTDKIEEWEKNRRIKNNKVLKNENIKPKDKLLPYLELCKELDVSPKEYLKFIAKKIEQIEKIKKIQNEVQR